MKKFDLVLNSIILILSITIIFIVVYRFALRKETVHDTFDIKNIRSVVVNDLDNRKIELSMLIANSKATYVMLFSLTDCSSCIYKGLEDMKKLRADDKAVLAIMVHDSIEEAAGWAASNDFSPLYTLKTSHFYEQFKSAVTPVIFKLINNKIDSFRYIIP